MSTRPPAPAPVPGLPAGTSRPITTYGTPVLHRRCAAVTAFDDGLRQLVADMFASMYASRGVGLAANQIGVDAQVYVYDCEDASGERRTGVLVNPAVRVPAFGSAPVTEPEGCLSVPGQHAPLARPGTAVATGVDHTGAPVSVAGTGLLARCLQHETDHLGGTVYVDRLPQAQRVRILRACGLPERPPA